MNSSTRHSEMPAVIAPDQVLISPSQGLLATYKQYKQDTEHIAGWLRTQSARHGFQPADRSKVRTGDFEKMAEAITAGARKGQFVIDAVIDGAFRRAITTRKRVTKWYVQHAHGQWESNERHSYFTNILLKTWNVLLNASSTTSPAAAGQKATGGKEAKEEAASTPIAGVTNQFSALTLDDLDDDDDGDDDDGDDDDGLDDLVGSDDGDAAAAGPSSSPNAPKKNKNNSNKKKGKNTNNTPATTNVLPDEKQIEEDFWFCIMSFLIEQQKIREIAKKYWQGYKDGKIDLIMASAGTRLAIDIIRRLEIELNLQVTRPARFPEAAYPVWKFPAMLLASQYFDPNDDGERGRFDAFVHQPGRDRGAAVTGEQEELYFYAPYGVLHIPILGGVPCFQGSIRACATPVTCLSAGPADTWAVLEAYLVYFKQITKDGTIMYEDEITRGIAHVFKENEASIWAVFAFRALLDIHDVLGMEDIGRPGAEVAEHIRAIIAASHFTEEELGSYRHDKKKASAQNPDGYDGLERNFLMVKAWVLQDIMSASLKSRVGRFFEPHLLFKLNPMHCGLIKYDQYRCRHSALRYENKARTGAIYTMMHCYVAGRAAYPNSVTWPDMEYLIHQQDARQLFIGGRPQTLDQCAKKWFLAQGHSMARIAGCHGPACYKAHLQGIASIKRWRPLKDNSLLGFFMGYRIHACPAHCRQAHDSFKDMINAMHSPSALSRLAVQLDKKDKADRDRFVDTWVSRLHSWKPADILELFQIYMSVDIADVAYNWEALHETCLRIWEAVHEVLRKKYDKRELGGTPASWTTVVLCDLAEAERAAQKKKTALADEINESVPAFVEMWILIQTLCLSPDTACCNCCGGRARTFLQGERSLFDLFNMHKNYSPPMPAVIAAPHLPKCFEGWPEELYGVSASKAVVDKFSGSRDGGHGTAEGAAAGEQQEKD